jgi:hypothetical protein
LGSADEHGAAFQLLLEGLEWGGEVLDVGGDEVVGDEVLEEVEPEEGELGEDAALIGNAGAEDMIEGGDAIRGDEEEVGVRIGWVDGVDVADFAFGEKGDWGKVCGEEGFGHVVFSIAQD